MHIDKGYYKIKEINRYKTKSAKTQIVIATSLRKNNYHITRLQHKDYGNTKKWNTFTISRDGSVYQHYDEKYHTDFLGVKEGDKRSISIVLENMGYLFQTETNKYMNWLNEYCDVEQVIEKSWGGYDYWEKFPDIQLKNLMLLIKELCEKHNIPQKFIEFNTHHKETHKFRGIVFKGNYVEDSSDTNPLLEISQLTEILHNEFI